MLHIFLSNAPGNIEYGTSGVAVPGYQVRLVDPEGNDVPDDEVGELADFHRSELVVESQSLGAFERRRTDHLERMKACFP